MKDVNTFSIAQATSNESGKTSGSGTAGLFLVFTGILTSIIATIGWLLSISSVETVFLFATGIIGTGAGLLGYRKSVDKTALENQTPTDEVK